MYRTLRNLVLAVLATLMLAAVPSIAQADDQGIDARVRGGARPPAHSSYWDNYWGWYDRDYSPYYHRQYRGYRAPRDSRYGYGYRGYGDDRQWRRGPRASVGVGPLRFNWY